MYKLLFIFQTCSYSDGEGKKFIHDKSDVLHSSETHNTTFSERHYSKITFHIGTRQKIICVTFYCQDKMIQKNEKNMFLNVKRKLIAHPECL